MTRDVLFECRNDYPRRLENDYIDKIAKMNEKRRRRKNNEKFVVQEIKEKNYEKLNVKQNHEEQFEKVMSIRDK